VQAVIKPKTGFKKTTIGEIPEEWKIANLKDVCTKITDGVHKTPKYQDQGIPFISVNNIATGKLDFSDCKYISYKDHQELIRRCFPHKGDILLGKVGTLGVADIVNVDFEFSIFVQIALLETDKNKIVPQYLKYILNSTELQKAIQMNASGTTLKYIGLNTISKLKVPLQSITEQQKIACILSKVDQLIQKTDQIIEQTERLKKGLMQRLLTKGIGHTKFKNVKLYNDTITIPEQWTLVKLRDYTTKIGSGVTPTGGSQVYVQKGIPLIRSQNVHFDGLKLDDVAYITQAIHNEMKNTKLQDNDVLLNITGASLGRCTFVPPNFGEGNVNQHVCIIRPKTDLNAIFLSYFLSSYHGQKMILRSLNGLSREGLTFKEIGSFSVAAPTLQEQKKIVTVMNSVQSKMQKVLSQKSNFEKLKKGLMQKLLTGKIRVKV